MKTIYLHIGTHKTGTTTIQKVLSENQEIILEKGYYYCQKCRIKYTLGNHPLAWSILHGDQMIYAKTGETLDFTTTWKDFLSSIPTSTHNIIISSEYFSLFDHANILTLKEYLSGFVVMPIIYLRKPDDFLLSLYSENIKSNAYFKSPIKFFEEQSGRVDYLSMLESWSQVFGHNSIVIDTYKSDTSNTTLINGFFKKIGMDMSHLDLKIRNPRLNVSPPIKFLKLLRCLNWLFHGRLGISVAQCRNLYLIRLLNARMVKVVSLIPDWALSDKWFSEIDKDQLATTFKEMNAKIVVDYLDKADAKTFS
ncbi:hypothetical protein [Leptolyngbya sp. PCC 6406]|uniref:hypothetical protein n=1 Tax=Leptolyngbya sp. PCC 6406 TaxID=1173264 RepID=UPI0002EAEE2A|nr:hypothetical protein [Leptolyngbya sp. PCC 6406]